MGKYLWILLVAPIYSWATTIACPEPDIRRIEAAPDSIYSIEVFYDEAIRDLSITVRNEIDKLPVDSLVVRRRNQQAIVFAEELSLHDYSKDFQQAHIVSVPKQELDSYDFVVTYARRNANCIYELERYEIQVPLNK